MLRQVRQKDLELFQDISGAEAGPSNEIPLQVLVPAFMISELRRAFEIGFSNLLTVCYNRHGSSFHSHVDGNDDGSPYNCFATI